MQTEMNHRLEFLMKHMGYSKETIDYIIKKHPNPTEWDLEHMCVVNNYEHFAYPDGYCVSGLDKYKKAI